MSDRLDDETLMTEYLLGQLSEEQQARVEDRFLRDPDYLDQLKVVEQELDDRYARGEMPAWEQQLFEKRISASPEWRRRTVLAKALVALDGEPATAQAATPTPKPPAFWASVAAFLRRQGPMISFSLTAAFLIAVMANLWLWIETSRLQSKLDALRISQQEIERRETQHQQNAAEDRARAEQLARELESERQRREQIEAKMRAAEPLPASLLSFILTPGIGRGRGESAKLVIPSGTKQVSLQIYLEGATDYRTYRAELRTAGKTALTRDALTARKTRLGKAITLLAPADLLPASEHEIVVSGLKGKDQREEIGSYYVNVVRP